MRCMTVTESPTAQWLRGLLDVCLLAVISEEPTYGYEMTRRLTEAGLDVVSEGSIYPALARLERGGLVTTYRESSPDGPQRKYYRATPDGEATLRHRRQQWHAFSHSINEVVSRGAE